MQDNYDLLCIKNLKNGNWHSGLIPDRRMCSRVLLDMDIIIYCARIKLFIMKLVMNVSVHIAEVSAINITILNFKSRKTVALEKR